jgi:uncharacterized MAPEG superfamily protein
MTTELRYLAYTALLTGALWIPYVITQLRVNGFLKPPNYVDPTPRPLPPFGHRADRAHINAVETFAPFAALVLIAQVAGKTNAMTATLTMTYFWLRLAHAVVYLLGFPFIRTLIFVLGFVCLVGLGCEVLR